jgi:integrase
VGSSQFDEIGRALSWLRNHLGDSTPLRAIRREHLREFRDGLERIDARLKGRGGYTFGDRQTGNAEHWISSVTATRHWRAVQAFFAWAVVEESAISSDPSAGLRIARRKADVSRTPEPFTSEELRRLFESPLYAGHKSPKQLLAPGTCRERGAFWWSGLLALYTGLRAGEIAQVLTSDFGGVGEGSSYRADADCPRSQGVRRVPP